MSECSQARGSSIVEQRWSPPFPCSTANRQFLWKKTLIEKKKKNWNKKNWEYIILLGCLFENGKIASFHLIQKLKEFFIFDFAIFSWYNSFYHYFFPFLEKCRYTVQKMTFAFEDCLSGCDEIRTKHLLKQFGHIYWRNP